MVKCFRVACHIRTHFTLLLNALCRKCSIVEIRKWTKLHVIVIYIKSAYRYAWPECSKKSNKCLTVLSGGATVPDTQQLPAKFTGDTAMSDLQARFEQAQIDLKSCPSARTMPCYWSCTPCTNKATAGDVSGERPGMMDFINRAKYDAWERYRGYSSEAAMK